MKCDICSASFNDGVQCTSCCKHLDFACAGVTEAGWKKLGAERRSTWKCQTYRASSPAPASKSQITIESLMKEIKDVKSQLSALPSIISDIKDIKEEFKELKLACQFASDKIDEFSSRLDTAEKRMEDLEVKYTALDNSLSETKLQLLNSEQRSRLNNVEIKGVPEKKDENLFKIVENINNKVGYMFPKNQINYISRVPSYNSKVKSIIISFINRYVKEEFLASARAFKTLKANDIGFQESTQRVYFNDHLSSESKLLLNKTREAAKINSYNYVWVKYGKIHVLKNDTSRAYVINKIQDLHKIA